MKEEMTIDPLRQFSDISECKISQSLGILPHYVMNEDYFHKDLKAALKEQYKFGMFELTGGKIDDKGIFEYPGDPELFPLIKIVRGDEIYYQYEHAIVAIVQKDGSTFITRLD